MATDTEAYTTTVPDASPMRVERLAYSGNRITVPQMMRDYGKTVSGGRLSAYLSAPIHHKLRASLATGKVKL